GILAGTGDPQTWPERRVFLPSGWKSIEVERLWIRGRPARLVARHGVERAVLELGRRRWSRRARPMASIHQLDSAPKSGRQQVPAATERRASASGSTRNGRRSPDPDD